MERHNRAVAVLEVIHQLLVVLQRRSSHQELCLLEVEEAHVIQAVQQIEMDNLEDQVAAGRMTDE